MRVLLEPVADVPQAPRHPEVNQENATALEPNNQILAASLDGDDALALQLGRDLERLERPHQPRVEDLDALKSPPDERGLELASDRLDLGQLGHGPSVATAKRSRLGPAMPASGGRSAAPATARRRARMPRERPRPPRLLHRRPVRGSRRAARPRP